MRKKERPSSTNIGRVSDRYILLTLLNIKYYISFRSWEERLTERGRLTPSLLLTTMSHTTPPNRFGPV